MKYCKDVTNLLFWELQECLTIPIKIIVSSCSKLSCLSRSKKSTSSLTFFLRYCKEIATLLLIAIWTCLIIFNQNNSINLKEPLTFIYGQKKINFILYAFLEILQTLWVCCSGDFAHAWLRTLKVIISTCRKFSCLSAGQKSTSSLNAFLDILQRYANFLFWVLWTCLVTYTQNDKTKL